MPSSGSSADRVEAWASLALPQRRIYRIFASNPTRNVHNIQYRHWLEPPIEPDLLREALQLVVARQSMLRTIFLESAGEPRQAVVRGLGPVWAWDRCAACTAGAAVGAVARAELNRPFDIRSEPPIRFRLVDEGSDRQALVLTVHHIAWDGQSTDVFFRDLRWACAYVAGAIDRPPPPLAVQYWQYADRQGAGPPAEALARSLRHWNGRLHDPPQPLRLPATPIRLEPRDLEARWIWLGLPPSTSTGLEAIRRRLRVSRFTLGLALLVLLLGRTTGQWDICVRTHGTDRGADRDLAQLVGLFAYDLPLRIDADPTMSFSSLAEHVQHVVISAQRHRHVPMHDVLETGFGTGDLHRTPMYDVYFQSDPPADPPRPSQIGDARLTPIAGPLVSAYKVKVRMHETQDGIAASSYCIPVNRWPASSVSDLLREHGDIMRTIADGADPLLGGVGTVG